jgi:hypothetical protein
MLAERLAIDICRLAIDICRLAVDIWMLTDRVWKWTVGQVLVEGLRMLIIYFVAILTRGDLRWLFDASDCVVEVVMRL